MQNTVCHPTKPLSQVKVNVNYRHVLRLKYEHETSKTFLISTLKSDAFSTLKSDVVSTLKSDVVSTLKSYVETTLKMGCFPDIEINNVVSTLKISWLKSRPKINLKTTLKQRCVPAGLLYFEQKHYMQTKL